MYEYGVSFKSVRYLEKYGSFIFLGVLQFINNDEKSWVCIDNVVIPQRVEILIFFLLLQCLKISKFNT